MNETTIREILAKIVPTIDWKTIDAEDSLDEAGLDSLDKASVFLELETLSETRIPDDAYGDIDTIKGIVTFLQTHA